MSTLGELDPSVRESVFPAYMRSVAQIFLIGVPASGLISLFSLYVGIFTVLHFIDLTIIPRAVRDISLAEIPENVPELQRELTLSRLPTKEFKA